MKQSNRTQALNGDASSSSVLTEAAQVVELQENEQGEHFALLQITPKNGCSGCASSGSCGTSALAKLFVSVKGKPIRVPNRIGAQLGEEVLVSMDESRLIKYSFMAYGLPLIGLLLGAICAQTLVNGGFSSDLSVSHKTPALVELVTVLGAACGMFSGWWITRKFYQPVLPEMHKMVINDEQHHEKK
ncbi:hypothetical protein THMIRHAS_15060 [Thiosulfatimonas sediminis]|uniref:SoxR reducing system protein RseC n=1 Tax=Thiosulfatimonas sediminis TaxID=2675054 RepID=A0A6F8PVG8_9GAMM|nr:SoxR reducing system RseC family protein [Thiosulfatimonas sediminis]BBP46133.1 hypothetical protein THMIRHAS_15060 [Thiosulfatimonas sediminis]